MTKDATNSKKLMTDIESLQASTDFQLVCIVGDIREDSDKIRLETAKNIFINFPNVPQLIPNDELSPILTKIRNAPTVFFVDGEGNIIGQPVVGNEPNLVEKEIYRLMNKDSEYYKMQNKADRNIFYAF